MSLAFPGKEFIQLNLLHLLHSVCGYIYILIEKASRLNFCEGQLHPKSTQNLRIALLRLRGVVVDIVFAHAEYSLAIGFTQQITFVF